MPDKNLQRIFDLVKEYSLLPKGILIEKHTETITVVEISEPEFANSKNVLITRRAIKHFVERRMEEFLKRNDFEKALKILVNIIFSLDDVFVNYDSVILDKGGLDIIFEKRSQYNNFIIRVVVENKREGLFIKTIHPKQIPPSQSKDKGKGK